MRGEEIYIWLRPLAGPLFTLNIHKSKRKNPPNPLYKGEKFAPALRRPA